MEEKIGIKRDMEIKMERNVRTGSGGSGWMTVAQKDIGGPKGDVRMKAAGGISAERMADLERRVQVLEERTRRAIWGGNTEALRREEALVERYGESVDKTVAARLLGVTRATVYAMLADGRICGACAGRRVDVRSIARYLSQRTPVQ